VVGAGADPRARRVGGVVGAALERCGVEVGRGSGGRGGGGFGEAATEVGSSPAGAVKVDGGVAEVEEAPGGGEGGCRQPAGMEG
jgi:hypothetical protein